MTATDRETTQRRARGSRGLRRGAAVLVLLLVAGVSLLAWDEPDEASVETLGNGVTWAIWTGAAIVAGLAAAVLFRRERELRIGTLQGVALGVLVALVVLWVRVATGAPVG